MKYAAHVAGLVLLAVLLLGVPLFVRTPLWVDATYHDISAKNVLQGGVHYRDIFETNLPGMVWLHCLVRTLVGWSPEAIRLVDLLVVGSAVVLLTKPMRGAGLTLAQRMWFLTAVSLFYLFETEFIHVQRDGWMLLPTVGATLLRWHRAQREGPAWRGAILEGFLWGCAVWIKPHAFVPALVVSLVSMRFQPRPVPYAPVAHAARVCRDLGVVVLGGLIAGLLGSAWLLATGTWSHLWEVMFRWNNEYYEWSWAETWHKVRVVTVYFAPFSVLHFVAVPLALFNMVRREPTRALVGALYLGWLLEATFIQKMFDYAHAPPMILALAVIAIQRWPVGPVLLVWCIFGSVANETIGRDAWFLRLYKAKPATMMHLVPPHSLLKSSRLQYWPRCWTDNSLELKDELTHFHVIHCAPEWVKLHHVAEYLRQQGVHDGAVIAWHDATHPLYLELGIKPGIRFPHVITVMRMKSKIPTIRAEAFASGAKFVVSDLVAVAHIEPITLAFPPGPTTALPDDLPASLRDVYPWNQPVVYRSGRYVVHRIEHPHGPIDFPLPGESSE